MTRTYQAILDGDRLRWTGEAPTDQGPVTVQVTVPAVKASPTDRSQAIFEALERLAELNPFASVTDPVAWQREIRKDRPLPGRD